MGKRKKKINKEGRSYITPVKPKLPIPTKASKIHKMYLLRSGGVTRNSNLFRQMLTKYNIKVTRDFIRAHNTDEKYNLWNQGQGVQRKPGSGRPTKMTPVVNRAINDIIEDDSIKLHQIPKIIKNKTKVSISPRSVRQHHKRSAKNPQGYHAHVTPLETPLRKDDRRKRLNYAKMGPIKSGNSSIKLSIGKPEGSRLHGGITNPSI